MVLIESDTGHRVPPVGTEEAPAQRRQAAWWAFVGVVSAVQLLVRWWTAIGLDHYHDDLLVSYRALDSPLTTEYLATMYDGHWGPVVALLQWVTVRVDPFDVGTAFGVVLLLLAVANIGVALMLREWVGTGGASKWAFVFWAASPITVTTVGSWSIGLAILPVAAGTAWTAWLHARALKSGRRRDVLVALVALALTLLTSPRALIAVPFLVLTTIAYPSAIRPQDTARAILRRGRHYWFAMGAIIVTYALAYLANQPERNGQSLTLAAIGDVVEQAVFRTAFPAAIGGPWVSDSGAIPSVGALGTLVASFVFQLVVALAIVTMLVRRDAWRAWAILAALTALQVAVLATALRFDLIGESLLRQTRYLMPLLVPAALLLALALGHGRVRSWVDRTRRRWRWVPAAALVASAFVFVESAWVTTYEQAASMKASSTHDFWVNVRDSLAEEPDAVLVDREMPQSVVFAGFLPELGQLSEALRFFVTDQRFSLPAESPRYLTDDGRLVAAEIEPYAFSTPGPDGDCGYLVKGRKVATIPMSKSTFNYQWGIELAYLAEGDSTLIAQSSENSTELPLEQGLRTITWTTPGILGSISFRLADPRDPAVCIDKLVVGGVVAGGDAS